MKKAIIKLINKWSCGHNWKLHREIKELGTHENIKAIRETLICKNCGKIKIIKYK